MFEQKSVTISDYKIAYYQYVSGNRRDLLFIHGSQTDSKVFFDLLRKLSEDFNVYSIDLPGHGRSSRLIKPLNSDEYGMIISSFIDRIGLSDIIICGHSIGGAIALSTCKQTKAISLCVLVDSCGIDTKQTLFNTVWRIAVLTAFQNIFIYPIHKGFSKMLVALFKNLIRKRLSYLNNIRSYVMFMTNTVIDLDKINTRVYIIWGRKDLAIDIKFAYLLNELIPNSTLEIVHGGHDWLLFNDNLLSKRIKILSRSLC